MEDEKLKINLNLITAKLVVYIHPSLDPSARPILKNTFDAELHSPGYKSWFHYLTVWF